MTETKDRPLSMAQSIFRSINDDQWYWTSSYGPVGPFRTREEARNDFRHKTGVDNDNNLK